MVFTFGEVIKCKYSETGLTVDRYKQDTNNRKPNAHLEFLKN